jgi:hypothetical protein
MRNITFFLRKRREKEYESSLYYPGSGCDFGPFYLFVEKYNVRKVIYSDYMISKQTIIDSIKEHLPRYRLREEIEINPEFYNKKSWEEFWPNNKYCRQDGKPEDAFGFKVILKNQKIEVDFTFLRTEAIRTYEILSELGIYFDIVVLQDHGFGGNWTRFGGENEILTIARNYKVPELLYIADNTDPWPGYTLKTDFELILKGQMHKHERAILQKDN